MQTETNATSWATVPNALCVLRLLACPVLLYLAEQGLVQPFLYLFIFLVFTDWIDGKIARWLHQRTTLGARLDSWADAAMYGSLLVSAWWLMPDAVRSEWPWVASALVTYVVAVLCCIAKFRRWPAYHTKSAKVCWLLTAVGVVGLFADVSRWPLRIAMTCVSLANLESATVTLVLSRWRADIASVLHALRIEGSKQDH